MNHLNRLALVAISLIVVACAGTAARQNVLLPALASTWASIRVQIERQASFQDDTQAPKVAAAASAALTSGDPVAIAAVNWTLLEDLALADIDRRIAAREIGPLVAESLRGRLVDFAASRRLYLRQP